MNWYVFFVFVFLFFSQLACNMENLQKQYLSKKQKNCVKRITSPHHAAHLPVQIHSLAPAARLVVTLTAPAAIAGI